MKAIREEHAGRPAGPLQVRISATGRAEIRPKEVTAEEANAGLESKLQLAVRTARAATPPSEYVAAADAEGEWESWCHLPCGATGRAPPLGRPAPYFQRPEPGRRGADAEVELDAQLDGEPDHVGPEDARGPPRNNWSVALGPVQAHGLEDEEADRK